NPTTLPKSNTIAFIRPSRHELDPRFAFADVSDNECLDPFFPQLPLHALGEIRADDHHEADAQVKNALHLRLLDVAEALQPREDGWNLPLSAADENAPSGRQNARHVVDQTAPGDVRQAPYDAPLHRVVLQQILDRPHINACRFQQFLPDRT